MSAVLNAASLQVLLKSAQVNVGILEPMRLIRTTPKLSLSDDAAPSSMLSYEAVLDRALAAFPGVEFAQGYGMTELSSGISFLLGHSHTPVGEGARTGKLLKFKPREEYWGDAKRPSRTRGASAVD